MKDRPKLYTYFRSSCSWRVRIALNIAGVQVDMVPIHLVRNGGEQHGEEYKSINPMGQVPALVIDDLTLTQSVAIMEYINDTNPGCGLLPSDPKERAKVRMISEIIASGIQSIQNLSVMKYHSDDQAKRQAWSNHWITKGFEALETVLKGTAGSCCVGDTPTMADCCLVPQVFNAKRFNVDMDKFPIISKLEQNLSKLPQFSAAHPSNQVDCPEELK